MIEATFRGTSQLNGPVPINKTIEVDEQTAKNLGGSKRDEVKLAILAMYYPGVEVNPRKISVNIKRKNKKEVNSDFEKFTKKTNLHLSSFQVYFYGLYSCLSN